MNDLGFIILRHVNNESTNDYWIHCYDCVRKYYPENAILIIDDGSYYEFITDKELYKTTIINSEYPKRGELLPYYYYLKNKLFDTAVIIHDSVFINKHIDFTVDNYEILWDFEHDWDQIADETSLLELFNDEELLTFYNNKSLWKGSFGCMSVVTHDYLTSINNRYNLSILLDHILTRHTRSCFERIIGCLLQQKEAKKALLGDIHSYCPWDIRFNDKEYHNHLPIIKVWTGR